MAVGNQLSNQNKRKEMFSDFMARPIIVQKVNNIVGGKDSQKFITAIVSAVTNNPTLQTCDMQTILTSAFLGESLKLSPSPQLGHYYMLPFNDKKKGLVAQFVLGYKGMLQLAIRSGQYKKLNVLAIKQGELLRYDALNEDIEVKLMDDELAREKAETIGYYAMFELTNGFRKTMYWSKEKMEAHALKYSAGYRKKTGHTFWEKDFDGMAYKTMLRQLISKWGIMSIDMQSAYEKDMAVIKEDGSPEYVDNPFSQQQQVTPQQDVVDVQVEESEEEDF